MTPLWSTSGSHLLFRGHFAGHLSDHERTSPRAWCVPGLVRWTDEWRLTAQNLVVHGMFGPSVTLATNGVLVVIDNGDIAPHVTHVGNLRGPVLRTPCAIVDWDWDRNARRVNVYRRRDGTVAVVPTDEWRDGIGHRVSREELELEAALGCGALRAEDFDTALAQLCEARNPGTRRATFLASL